MKIYNRKDSKIVDCDTNDLYQYKVYIGENSILLNPRCSYWYVDNEFVISRTGDSSNLNSQIMCVEIFGYTPEYRMSSFSKGTDLPYINGCSTKQLINPTRSGDPTFQMLYIPKGVSEQQHHIHSTPRVVYVAEGSGLSIVGTENNFKSYALNQGDIIILPKMMPHHFETHDTHLLVLPVHVFSSGLDEYNHPMFNGTKKVK